MKDISQEIIIKQVSPDQVNLNEVVAIIHEAFSVLLKQGIDSPTAHISTEELKKRNHTHYFCAYDKKQLIGFVNGKLYPNRTCYFDIVAVLPEYKQQGIGSMLLDIFEQKIFGLGVKYIFLNTMLPSKRNIHLYLKRGYVKYYKWRYTAYYYSITFCKYKKLKWYRRVITYATYICSIIYIRIVWKTPAQRSLIGRFMQYAEDFLKRKFV